MHKSHISDLARLAWLMVAAYLAYIWIYLGVIAERDDWVKIIHRTDRCEQKVSGVKQAKSRLDQAATLCYNTTT